MDALALSLDLPATEGQPPNIFGKAKKKSSIEYVKSSHTNELVIALCGPIGSPIKSIAEILVTLLTANFNYQCTTIKLSDFIKTFSDKVSGTINESTPYKRVKSLIETGDALRKKYGSGILAELAIRQISLARNARKTEEEGDTFEPARVCHIINSIKNQEEFELLRVVYRDMFHCIGIGSPMALREENMKREGMSPKDIFELIDQDSGEEFAHGQTVRDTYPHSDFFLRADSANTENVTNKLERYLCSILDTQVITPTIEEAAMFLAASAAANSACLSRQIGAAITDADGNIVALGWNDVPKAHGGLYCASNANNVADMRCKNINGGECQSDFWKKKTASDIAESLIDKKLVERKHKDAAVKTLLTSKVKDLLEFSKAIHAEMHAIISGAQKTGSRMIGGKLFCTTYPCHQCARHIILAGITDVYYIEPYRKSLATLLHSDAITEIESETNKVRILPFDGISPNRYLEVFSTREKTRKKNGKAVVVNPREAALKAKMTLESLPRLEAAVVRSLEEQALQ